MAVSFCTPAFAQNLCGPRQEIVDRLFKKWGEVPHSQGLVMDGRLLEIFVSPEKRSWTAVISDPSGRSCVASAGEAFQAVDPKKTSF